MKLDLVAGMGEGWHKWWSSVDKGAADHNAWWWRMRNTSALRGVDQSIHAAHGLLDVYALHGEHERQTEQRLARVLVRHDLHAIWHVGQSHQTCNTLNFFSTVSISSVDLSSFNFAANFVTKSHMGDWRISNTYFCRASSKTGASF